MKLKNQKINRLVVPLLVTLTLSAHSLVNADEGEEISSPPDIVLDEEQAELWAVRSKACGNAEGQGCLASFRAILRPEQAAAFDLVQEKKENRSFKSEDNPASE